MSRFRGPRVFSLYRRALPRAYLRVICAWRRGRHVSSRSRTLAGLPLPPRRTSWPTCLCFPAARGVLYRRHVTRSKPSELLGNLCIWFTGPSLFPGFILSMENQFVPHVQGNGIWSPFWGLSWLDFQVVDQALGLFAVICKCLFIPGGGFPILVKSSIHDQGFECCQVFQVNCGVHVKVLVISGNGGVILGVVRVIPFVFCVGGEMSPQSVICACLLQVGRDTFMHGCPVRKIKFVTAGVKFRHDLTFLVFWSSCRYFTHRCFELGVFFLNARFDCALNYTHDIMNVQIPLLISGKNFKGFLLVFADLFVQFLVLLCPCGISLLPHGFYVGRLCFPDMLWDIPELVFCPRCSRRVYCLLSVPRINVFSFLEPLAPVPCKCTPFVLCFWLPPLIGLPLSAVLMKLLVAWFVLRGSSWGVIVVNRLPVFLPFVHVVFKKLASECGVGLGAYARIFEIACKACTVLEHSLY